VLTHVVGTLPSSKGIDLNRALSIALGMDPAAASERRN
jgi:hypothetical protein